MPFVGPSQKGYERAPLPASMTDQKLHYRRSDEMQGGGQLYIKLPQEIGGDQRCSPSPHAHVHGNTVPMTTCLPHLQEHLVMVHAVASGSCNSRK